jgi:hypothetical protein
MFEKENRTQAVGMDGTSGYWCLAVTRSTTFTAGRDIPLNVDS